MAIPGIQEIQALATKYSKPQLQKMAQMGLIDPTKAVMAGMMIDRIQKQNMQPPQQTVAEEVMGAPQPPQQMPQQAAGVAGLPSNLPPQMAGGGIVAFADGGDIDEYADGGVVGYADRGLVDSRNDPAMRIDPRVQAERDRLSIPYLMDDLEYARRTGDPALIAAAEREVRRRLGNRPNADIPLPISEARAAEPRRQSKVAATDVDYYQDPLGAPDYTTEDFSLKEKVEPGKRYEPSVRGMLFGYEQGKLPEITPPKKETKPEAAPAPAPAPKAAEKEAPTVEKKAEMGPPRPDMFAALRNIGIQEPEALTLDKALEEQDKAYEKAGVNKDLFAQIRQDYEGRRGKFADRADKAAGHALMMFGAGLMGARRGEEFLTASKSAQQSLMMYMSSMDKLTDQEDRLDQSLRELTIAEDQYKRTRADSALAKVQKQQEKIDAIRLENAKLELTAMAKAAEFNVDLIKNENPPQYKLIERIAKDSGKSPVDIFMMAQGIAKTGNLTLNQALEAVQRNPMFMGKTPAEQMQEAQRMVGGGGGGGATYNYVPGKGLVPAQ